MKTEALNRRRSTGVLDLYQRFLLPVAANFHHHRDHENNHRRRNCHRQSHVAVSDRHIRMDAHNQAVEQSSYDAEQQSESERKHRQQESYRHGFDWHQIPVWDA